MRFGITVLKSPSVHEILFGFQMLRAFENVVIFKTSYADLIEKEFNIILINISFISKEYRISKETNHKRV